MPASRLRKRAATVSIEKVSFCGRLRLGTCVPWLAILGLVTMQSWLAFSNAAKVATGATYTWNGATSDWSAGSNWGGTAPVGNINPGTIIFNGTGTKSVVCNSDVSGIDSLSLSGKAYTITGSGTWTFNNNATITDNGNYGPIILGNLTAVGNLTITSTGSGGSLIIGNGGPGETITLQNNGTLTLNGTGNSVIVQPSIAGSGSLTIEGTEFVSLYASNSYTGSTTVNGRLNAGCTGALPSTTEVTIASGGTLYCLANQTCASVSGAGSVSPMGTTLTLAGSNDSTFSGAIQSLGSGTVTKTGTGTMTMTSSSTVSSTSVNVNAGTLDFNGRMADLMMTVGPSGTLTGTGTVYHLINNGTISPGNAGNPYGTMTVNGMLTNGANTTIVVHVNATEFSKLAITSPAILGGGTVRVVAASDSYTVGQRYRFLTSDTLIVGTFSPTVVCDDTSLAFELAYGSLLDPYVELVLTRAGCFDDKASTGNQHAVAGYLDRQKTGASGDFATVINELNSLDTAASRAAFDALGGEIFGSLSTIGLENTENFLTNLASRLRQQSMTRGMTFDTAQKRWDESLLLVSRHQSWLREKAEGWTTWAEGFGVGARLASNGNASGLGYSTGGLSLGMEKWLEEDLLVGLAGGYSNTYTLLDERNDRSTIDAGHLAVYFQREFETRYLNGMAAYGYNAYDSLRHVDIGSLTRTAEAAYGGNSFSFYTEVGQNVRGRFLHLQPYAALEYIQLHQNGFTETGADSVNLSVGGVGADAFRGLLGSRVLSYLRTDAGRLITLEGRAAWRHEFLDENRILDATFAGQSGTAYAIQGINVDRDAAILGTGLTYDMTKSLKFGLNYDLLFSSNYTAHAGTGNVQLAW